MLEKEGLFRAPALHPYGAVLRTFKIAPGNFVEPSKGFNTLSRGAPSASRPPLHLNTKFIFYVLVCLGLINLELSPHRY